MQEAFNFGDLANSLGEGLFLSMSGGEVVYDLTLPDLARVVSFEVGGVPIDPMATYTVAVGEGELQVLDWLVLQGAIAINYTNLQSTNIEVWQALKTHFGNLGSITEADGDVEGRYRTVPSDLGIENYHIVPPASFAVGDQVNLDVTVANYGETAHPGGGTLELYYDNTPFDWTDDPSYDSTSLIGSVSLPAVAAFPGTTTLQIPWDTTGVRPGEVPLYARLVGLSEQNGVNHFAFRRASGLDVPWRLLTGMGQGLPNAPNARVWQGLGTPTREADFSAYGATGYGVNVAAGDLDGMGDEMIAGPGPGAVYGPQFRGFRLDGTSMGKVNGYAYGTLKFGVNVAGADLDADGYGEILTGAGPGAVFGPHVRAFNFDGTQLSSINRINFFAYNTLKFGVFIARGDLDGDGYAELLTAPGPSPVFASTIRGFNYDVGPVGSIAKINFNPYPGLSYGARVDAADIDADGYDEILTSPGPDPIAAMDVAGFDFDGGSLSSIPGLNLGLPGYMYGANVTGGDVDVDGYAEIIVSPGPDPAAPARVQGFNVDNATPLPAMEFDFLVYDPETYGADAAIAVLGP